MAYKKEGGMKREIKEERVLKLVASRHFKCLSKKGKWFGTPRGGRTKVDETQVGIPLYMDRRSNAFPLLSVFCTGRMCKSLAYTFCKLLP